MAIDRRLPIEVLKAVTEAVKAAKVFDDELVRSLDERYELRNKYLISPLGLRTFLYRIHAPDGATPTVNLAKHRRRQKSIAELLDHVFGPWRKCRPELWEHRTFLMLVGILYERLATNEKEIPTKELVAMSKALAEQRRAQAQSGASHESNEERPDPGDGQLPANFPVVVRQIYGMDFEVMDKGK